MEPLAKIKEELSLGKTREEIYKDLLNQSIPLEQIEKAFRTLEEEKVQKVTHDNTQKNAILIIVSTGALLVGVGIFSFIAANWADLPKVTKLLIILVSMTGSYSIGWFLKEDFGFKRTGMALIFLGSLCYGAGVFLVAQIFNVRANWPDGFLLWFIGLLLISGVIKARLIYFLGLLVACVYLWTYPLIFIHITYLDTRLYGSSFLLFITMILTFVSGLLIHKKVNKTGIQS